jgi:hypothetical protein
MMATMSSPSPLVGREREQETLRERLQAALAGHGGLVLIGGEAGIGKTSLAEEACRDATERGALVLVGRCYDLTETPPTVRGSNSSPATTAPLTSHRFRIPSHSVARWAKWRASPPSSSRCSISSPH